MLKTKFRNGIAYYIPSIDQVYKYGPIENMSRKKKKTEK